MADGNDEATNTTPEQEAGGSQVLKEIAGCLGKYGVLVEQTPDARRWEFRDATTGMIRLRWTLKSRRWKAYAGGEVYQTGRTRDPWFVAQLACQVQHGYTKLLVPSKKHSLFVRTPFAVIPEHNPELDRKHGESLGAKLIRVLTEYSESLDKKHEQVSAG